ncbi:LysE family translocator [Aquipseudomonas guryensis]|jgi:threonine/homoserine/homoserine lactone efflux protein|uniref:LysE family translocator n=1 Tax=Aquipseudomonas guryensis TaxID=2759165 RepID=A0A7W4H4M0_9GAMM|nr:LysE family translocator [Pseudomonas guryensis]MBB1520690.1 LysE family translocator [Pseudomonas guryensis]
MSLTAALLAYLLAASLLTVTPGVDTALILRTAALEGPKRAAMAALGINAGCLLWGAGVALGLGALLAASELAFNILKWSGAAYLLWLGLQMLLKPRSEFRLASSAAEERHGQLGWFIKGLLGNLLNPKVGVFYVSFLPQFVPAGYPVGSFSFALACIHVLLGLLWAAALILATRPLAAFLRRGGLIQWLDRATGSVLLVFAAGLALAKR